VTVPSFAAPGALELIHMTINDSVALRAAVAMLGVPVETLWTDYLGLGGGLSLRDVVDFIEGHTAVSDDDYDRLVQAANERFMDREENHPVPYSDEMRHRQSG